MISTICLLVLRMSFAVACDAVFATVRSMTLVNSSIMIGLFLGAVSIASAVDALNCSPLDRVWCGCSHVGGDPNPILVSVSTISSKVSLSGKLSRMDFCLSHFCVAIASGPKISVAIVVLPAPLGPTITPIFHSLGSVSFTSHFCVAFSVGGTSKSDSALMTRGVRWIFVSRVMRWCGTCILR